MRHSALLLTGLVLIGAGVAVLVSHLPGRFVIGVALVVVGVLVKVGGFLISDDPVRARSGTRNATTLDGHVVESPRPGVPTGRASLAARGPLGARSERSARIRPARAATVSSPIAPPTRRAG